MCLVRARGGCGLRGLVSAMSVVHECDVTVVECHGVDFIRSNEGDLEPYLDAHGVPHNQIDRVRGGGFLVSKHRLETLSTYDG